MSSGYSVPAPLPRALRYMLVRETGGKQHANGSKTRAGPWAVMRRKEAERKGGAHCIEPAAIAVEVVEKVRL